MSPLPARRQFKNIRFSPGVVFPVMAQTTYIARFQGRSKVHRTNEVIRTEVLTFAWSTNHRTRSWPPSRRGCYSRPIFSLRWPKPDGLFARLACVKPGRQTHQTDTNAQPKPFAAHKVSSGRRGFFTVGTADRTELFLSSSFTPTSPTTKRTAP